MSAATTSHSITGGVLLTVAAMPPAITALSVDVGAARYHQCGRVSTTIASPGPTRLLHLTADKVTGAALYAPV